MDRFIDDVYIIDDVAIFNLKSNMDRFIVKPLILILILTFI